MSIADNPIFLTLSSAGFGLLAGAGLWLVAKRIFGSVAGGALVGAHYLLLLAILGSLLSVRAWLVPYPFEKPLSLLLGCGLLWALADALLRRVCSIKRWWADIYLLPMENRCRPPALSLLAPMLVPMFVPTLIFALLLCDLLWAAAPFYRYDQWNYHLVVSKYVHLHALLPLPILDDHIYFTGFYEYLLLLVRPWTSSDLFIHGFASAFNWVSMFLLIKSAVQFLAVLPLTSLHLFALSWFCLGALPFQHSLTNAKPEMLLVAVTFWILLLDSAEDVGRSPDHQKRCDSRSRRFWLGWLLVFPLSIKVTWLHMGGALGLFFVGRSVWRVAQGSERVRRNHGKKDTHVFRDEFNRLVFLSLGGLFGLLTCMPTFLKNYFYFKNPFHPIQVGPFQSAIYSELMAKYWKENTNPAQSLSEYLSILLFATPTTYLHLSAGFGGLLAACLGGMILSGRKNCSTIPAFISSALDPYRRSRPFFIRVAIVGAIYSLAMPFFLDPTQLARFALPYVGLAVPMFIIFWLKARIVQDRRPLYLGLIGLVSFGFDVKLLRLGRLWQAPTVSAFYQDYGPPYGVHKVAMVVNRHREITYPGAHLNQKIIVANHPVKFFFNSTLLYAGAYMDRYWQDLLFKNPLAFPTKTDICIPRYFKSMDVAYVSLSPNEANDDHSPLLDLFVAKYGTPLTDADYVWHLSADALSQATFDFEFCPHSAR